MKKLLIVLSMLVLATVSEATAQGAFEVKIYPMVDCLSFAFETLDPEHPTLGLECKDPELVFTYTYYSQSEARGFARQVAHQGLERLISGTTPRAKSILILYPTIKKITVRYIGFRRFDHNDPVPCLGTGCLDSRR